MATYTIDQGTNTTTNQGTIEPSGNRGSHYNPAAEFLYYVNETTGTIWRQPVNPATVLVPTITQQQSSFNFTFNLNGTGALDISVSGSQVIATNLSQAQVAPLSNVTSLTDITPTQLMDTSLQWGQSSSLSNLSSAELFFAVRIPYTNTPNISDNHYAAVRIYQEQGQNKIQWITYLTSTKPLLLHELNDEYPSPRDIVVSEGNAFLYVSGGALGEGYILEIPRVAPGPFPQYSTNPVPLNSALLHNPQQMVVEGNLIYVVDGDGLYVINKVDGEPVQVISGITDPIGLLFDDTDTTSIAYISTKTGDLYKVDFTDFLPPVYDNGNYISASPTIAATESDKLLSLGTSSGHLTWADAAQSAFYATLPLTNEIARVDLITNTKTILQTDTLIGASPQSVVVFDQYNLSVICDAEIGDIYCGIPVTDVLVMGIGFIPFNYITNSIPPYPLISTPNDGKADTSSAPGYFFSGHPNLPFAGRLTILVNHEAAWNSGARFFKVQWRDENNNVRQITTSFVDLLWQTIGGIPGFYPETVNTDYDYYSVRNPDDQWYNPYFGFVVDTSDADNGLNHLTVEFFDASRQPLQNGSFERRVYVDVTKSGGLLLDLRIGTDTELPALGTNQAPSSCGVIVYQSKNNRIAIDLKAWRADGLGKYTLSCYRGGTSTFVSTGNVATDDSSLISVVEYSPGHPLRIGHLVGSCNVANVTIVLDVPARAINGFEWVNLGYRAGKSFALAIHPVDETPWTDPG